MGGSAIAGDLAAGLASVQGKVPISVVRDLRVPFRLDESTLFVACSYSGNTQETLSLFQQARQANCRVLAMTNGGTLAEQAKADGVPLLDVGVSVEPRSAVGYNLMLLLGVLQRLGLAEIGQAEVRGAVESLRRALSCLTEEIPTRDNPAKQLAMELRGKLILVYGGGLFEGVARRWKCQFNENAKVWAFFETIPEVLHNSVEAFGASPAAAGQAITLLLQPASGAGATAPYYSVVAELLQRSGIPHQILQGGNGSPLAELLGMVLLGDYSSYYLALLQGVDPAPTPNIALAKGLLASTLEGGLE
jgi:glucose/mannose-6-phosphate isomerase